MRRYLLRRLGQSVVTLVLSTMVVFAGVRALPGDPARALAGEQNDPAQIAAIRAEYGLDDPVWVQYWHYLSHSLRGDLGTSVRTGIPVSDMLRSALPVTAELSLLAMLVAAVIGVLAGVVAATRRGTVAEWVANGFALLGLSVPNFWLGLMTILWLAVALEALPASGYVPFRENPAQNLQHMILPGLVLGTQLAAVIMRQTRSSMLDALETDYIRTARAKGLRERTVVWVHGLRNSLIVVVTIVGLQLGALISGAVVTERIFALPGFGKLTVDAVFQRDYPVIQAVVLVTATAYIVINLLVDLLYSLIDPRIRVAGEAV
jgi:peptide/nickel transport system permease protein